MEEERSFGAVIKVFQKSEAFQAIFPNARSYPARMMETPNGFDITRTGGNGEDMQAVQFEQSVFSIVEKDHRFDPHAFFFLKDALDFTLKRVADTNGGQTRHVSGPELLAGFRDLALDQFGPMATTLLGEWGINQCQDVGDMVFLLIDEQVFGKQDSDKPEDFAGDFDLHETLRNPFLPARLRKHDTPKTARTDSVNE